MLSPAGMVSICFTLDRVGIIDARLDGALRFLTDFAETRPDNRAPPHR
jgi:hypothetical protein